MGLSEMGEANEVWDDWELRVVRRSALGWQGDDPIQNDQKFACGGLELCCKGGRGLASGASFEGDEVHVYRLRE